MVYLMIELMKKNAIGISPCVCHNKLVKFIFLFLFAAVYLLYFHSIGIHGGVFALLSIQSVYDL